MTTLRISITKEVLQATKDCPIDTYSENCAISNAIRSIWPTAIVHGTYIYPFGKEDKDRGFPSEGDIKIEHNQKLFTIKFDSATPAERAAMQPFSFEIEVPDEVIGEVNIEEIRRICEGSKTLELV